MVVEGRWERLSLLAWVEREMEGEFVLMDDGTGSYCLQQKSVAPRGGGANYLVVFEIRGILFRRLFVVWSCCWETFYGVLRKRF